MAHLFDFQYQASPGMKPRLVATFVPLPDDTEHTQDELNAVLLRIEGELRRRWSLPAGGQVSRDASRTGGSQRR